MDEKFTAKEARLIADALKSNSRSMLAYADQAPSDMLRKVEVDLSIARTHTNPISVSFSAHTVFCATGTDADAVAYVTPYKELDGRTGIPMKMNQVFKCDFPVKGFNITNEAQAGKKLVFYFILYGSVESGSLSIDLNEQVNNINIGNSIANNNSEAVHLYTLVNTSSFINSQYNWKSFCAKNKANTMISNPDSVYIVPNGKKLVITGMELFVEGTANITGDWGMFSLPYNHASVISGADTNPPVGSMNVGYVTSNYLRRRLFQVPTLSTIKDVNPFGSNVYEVLKENPTLEVKAGFVPEVFFYCTSIISANMLLEFELIGFLVDDL